MSHTPELHTPWRQVGASIYDSADVRVAVVGLASRTTDDGHHLARLIAAAPEMLKWAQDAFAKQVCVCKLNPLVGGPVPCQTCELGSLIARATGGQQ